MGEPMAYVMAELGAVGDPTCPSPDPRCGGAGVMEVGITNLPPPSGTSVTTVPVSGGNSTLLMIGGAAVVAYLLFFRK